MASRQHLVLARHGARRRASWLGGLEQPVAVVLLLWLAAAVPAQPPAMPGSPQDLETIDLPAPLDLTLIDDPIAESFVDRPEGFGEDDAALEAYIALGMGRYLRARELTEQLLEEDPDSFTGHCLLGMVLHHAEGNLPLALFHLQRCRQEVEVRYGPQPPPEAPWFWHAMVLGELAFVSGEMDRHEDKIRYLDERDEIYSPSWPADRGWPLMRLRRYDEARLAVQQGLESEDPGQMATARTALCAIEAEQLRREESYVACRLAAEEEQSSGRGGPTAFTNAAEAALGVLKMAEAESLILEGTRRFGYGSVANPWLDLTHLYLSQGRAAEALDAIRQMFEWRRRQPPSVDVQNRAESEMASAIFLLFAGRPFEAAKITARALEQPDRTGFTSAESEQMEAASALLDRVAHNMAAELLGEEAVARGFFHGLQLRLMAQRHRLRAWSSGRRAASHLAGERILLTTLRPYLAGAVEIPEWLEPELVAILGPGIVASALEETRQQETLERAEGYFRVYDTEIAWRRGALTEALLAAEQTLMELPEKEVLLRARAAAIGAQAAFESGDAGRALELFDHALQLDPGVVRRLGLALPCTFAASPTPLAEEAMRALVRSPRFTRSQTGFRIQIEAVEEVATACLEGPQGARLTCVEVRPRAGENVSERARRLARELHVEAFAPRLDLTQADLRSLDGSPTVGSSEHLRTVLSDVIEQNSQ